jgi:hypothetical protein
VKWSFPCNLSFKEGRRGDGGTHPANSGTSYVVPVKRENEKCLKNFIFCKNSRLENRPDSGNTLPFESHCGFASGSTILSPTTNSESKRYQYPVCPAKAGPPIIPYPDSKVQREALDCPSRGPLRPPRSCSGFSRRKSKMFSSALFSL